jgi:hypothetical protein
LEEHKKLKQLISKVGPMNLSKAMSDPKALMRNPGQLMGKQLGGTGNLMNMMQEMSNNPQMSEMMKQFGGM